MNNRSALNGVDCLMLAFDYQLKSQGFAGNMAQIVLGLPERLPAEFFRKRLDYWMAIDPVLKAPLVQRFWKGFPHLVLPSRLSLDVNHLFIHALTEPAGSKTGKEALESRRKQILNTPLRIDKGQWVRFDLIYLPDGKREGPETAAMELVMTWHHVLMDARGAEFFLHLIGNEPAGTFPSDLDAAESRMSGTSLLKQLQTTDRKKKWQLAERTFRRIDGMAPDGPVSLYSAFKNRARSMFDYRVSAFSAAETQTIQARCRQVGAVLNESAFFMANSLLAFQRLHLAKGVATLSQVVSFPVDLRKIGSRQPIFGNHAGTLLFVFKPADMRDELTLMRLFRAQAREAVEQDLVFANLCALDLSRFLPTWFYTRKIKQSLNGEIASLIFANPGRTFEGLSRFMGQRVMYQYHIPTVVAPPGIGVVFYNFAGKQMMTLVFVQGLISSAEADGLVNEIRANLLGGV